MFLPAGSQWIKVTDPTPLPTTQILKSSVYFKGDSSALLSLAKKVLGGLASKVKAIGGENRIKVTGWVQRTADTSRDMELSRARAAAVVAYLKKLGVKGAYVSRAAGIAVEKSEAARRVDVLISSTK